MFKEHLDGTPSNLFIPLSQCDCKKIWRIATDESQKHVTNNVGACSPGTMRRNREPNAVSSLQTFTYQKKILPANHIYPYD